MSRYAIPLLCSMLVSVPSETFVDKDETLVLFQDDIDREVLHRNATAAVCFSGHLRSFVEMEANINRYLLQAFPQHEAFFLINMKDTYSNWRYQHFKDKSVANIEEVLPALKRSGSVIVKTYSDLSYKQYMPKNVTSPTRCFDPRPPPGEWQRHGSQMWSISHCFDMVYEFEKKYRSNAGPYRWIVRARPDAWPNQDLLDEIKRSIVDKADKDLSAPSGSSIKGKIWTGYGTGSDPLFIAERSAALALSSIWMEFFGNECATLPSPGPCRSVAKVYPETKTECLIDRHIRRFPEVEVVRKSAMRTNLRRPAGFYEEMDRRKNASKVLKKEVKQIIPKTNKHKVETSKKPIKKPKYRGFSSIALIVIVIVILIVSRRDLYTASEGTDA